MGEHLFMPVESTVGLILAKEGMQGKKLGQISGYRNLAMILGSVIVWLAGEFLLNNNHILNLKEYYSWLYFVAGLVAFLSVFAFSRMNLGKHELENSRRFVVRKEYGYFYWLNILFGARKQLFLTFAPWVLVTVFKTGPEKIALLIMIASILGVVFRQAFGVLTDKFGEVKMFMADAIILLCICVGFAYSQNIWLLYALYIMDNLMFASRIARTTYLNKIAKDKRDIPATISFGLSIDHLVSMTIPFFGGLLWIKYGYQSVFMMASILSVCGFVTALFIGRNLRLKAAVATV
jgi:MFS family permease